MIIDETKLVRLSFILSRCNNRDASRSLCSAPLTALALLFALPAAQFVHAMAATASIILAAEFVLPVAATASFSSARALVLSMCTEL